MAVCAGMSSMLLFGCGAAGTKLKEAAEKTAKRTDYLDTADDVDSAVYAASEDDIQSAGRAGTEEVTKVSGLAESADDISEAVMTQLQIAAEDLIREEALQNLNAAAYLSGSEYIGNYFLKRKEAASLYQEDENRMYLIYKNIAHIDYISQTGAYQDDFVYYTYVEFDDVRCLGSEEDMAEMTGCDTPGEGDTDSIHIGLRTGSSQAVEQDFVFYGFESIGTFERNHIEPEMDAYICEANMPEDVMEQKEKTRLDKSDLK